MVTPLYPEHYTAYLSLNRSRFNRIYKQFIPSVEFIERAHQIKQKTRWTIITEPWCGDAAQNVPILLKLIETINGAEIQLELRDQSELIDQYLTNGGRSIPKVIVRDENGQDLFVWGPRPAAAQTLYTSLKAEGTELTELHKSLHGWYADNAGTALQEEIFKLIVGLN
jgi:hypothetical protein